MTERRETARRRTCLGASIRVAAFMPEVGCYLRNLSLSGAKLVVAEEATLPDVFDLVVACRQEMRRARLVWRRGGEAGVRFEAAPSDRATGVTLNTEAFAALERSPSGRLH